MARLTPLAAAIVVCAAVITSNVVLPDLRTGDVNGLAGLLYWPADPPGSDGEPRPLPTAEGCTAHFVPHKDFDRELRYPCGKWFVLPAADRYNLWLETSGRMSSTPMMVIYGDKPFQGAGVGAIVAVSPAGRVAIPHDRKMTDGESLRLLSIEARNPWADRIFDRRVSARDARTPVQMPEGRVVVGRFDRKTNDAIALAKPVEIRAGKTALVWPEAPADSDVLLILTKPPELQLAKPIPARLAIDDGTSKRAPDVLLNGFDRIIAIWYGVAARRATISFQIPPKSTQLLILPPAAYASNAYDSVAQRVEYPWPARVTAPKF